MKFARHLLVSVPSSLLHLPHSKASRLPLHSFERSSAFPHFVSPSEGVQFLCVFCSPSEGAQSHGALCSACARVYVSSRLLPPSEGVQFSRVFCSPSEGAQSHGALCSVYARVSVSSCLFPPSEGAQFPRVFCSPSEGAHVYLYHDCREMRESVPLRKESKRDGGTTVSFTCAMAKEIAKQGSRNGRESREILPL